MSKKKKSGKKLNLQRKGYLLIILLAIMILVVSSITMSYSWFKPESKNGNSMNYTAGITVRTEDCEITSSTAADVENALAMNEKTGDLVYSTDEIDSAHIVPANQIHYFKTVITNNAAKPTNVSLYIKSLPAPNSSSSTSFSYGLGVAVPSNTYRTFDGTSQFNDVCIIRNAYIEGTDAQDAQNTLTVEWFIKTCELKDGESWNGVTLYPYSRTEQDGGLYLSYN